MLANFFVCSDKNYASRFNVRRLSIFVDVELVFHRKFSILVKRVFVISENNEIEILENVLEEAMSFNTSFELH